MDRISQQNRLGCPASDPDPWCGRFFKHQNRFFPAEILSQSRQTVCFHAPSGRYRRGILFSGAVYRAGRNGGHRESGWGSRRYLSGRARGHILDVDLRAVWHDDQVRGSGAVRPVSGQKRKRVRWRTNVSHFPGHGRPVAVAGFCLLLFRRCRILWRGKRNADQFGNRQRECCAGVL